MSADAPVSINDLKAGMELRGKVTNIELFGAFIDIGIGQAGLLHISQLGKPNVRNVEDVVKVGEEITVYVLKVDKGTGRVALSLVKPPSMSWDDLQEGITVTGTVVRVEKFGAFVDIGAEKAGMIHVSELADGYVKSPSDVVKVGQEVQARIIKVDRKNRKIDLSLKTAPQPVEAIDEEEEEGEVLTAMALALRKAMRSGEEAGKASSRSRKAEKRITKHQVEQDEILQRTLRQHSTR